MWIGTYASRSGTAWTHSLAWNALIAGFVALGTAERPLKATSIDAMVAGTETYPTLSTDPTTSTVLAVNKSSAYIGEPVTFTATVSGATTPSGTVQFKDGGVNYGSAVALVNGVATFTTPDMLAGSRSITAAYSGDADQSSSTSNSVTVTISALPSVARTAAMLLFQGVNHA
jgi:hypothetical protein